MGPTIKDQHRRAPGQERRVAGQKKRIETKTPKAWYRLGRLFIFGDGGGYFGCHWLRIACQPGRPGHSGTSGPNNIVMSTKLRPTGGTRDNCPPCILPPRAQSAQASLSAVHRPDIVVDGLPIACAQETPRPTSHVWRCPGSTRATYSTNRCRAARR